MRNHQKANKNTDTFIFIGVLSVYLLFVHWDLFENYSFTTCHHMAFLGLLGPCPPFLP